MGRSGEVYRVGGDEFGVLSTLTAADLCTAVDTAIRAAQAETRRPVNASVEGATRGETLEFMGLYALADQRMDAMKRRRQRSAHRGPAGNT